MAITKEKLIEQIMKECEKDGEPVTKEEATEMAEMEIKAKGLKIYAQTEKPRKKAVKERKVDENKKRILEMISDIVLPELQAENITMNTETKLNFTYEGEEYTLMLTKHRPPK